MNQDRPELSDLERELCLLDIPEILHQAVCAGQLPSDFAQKVLMVLCESPHPGMRVGAVDALSLFDEPIPGVKFVLTELEDMDPNESVRSAATCALVLVELSLAEAEAKEGGK